MVRINSNNSDNNIYGNFDKQAVPVEQRTVSTSDIVAQMQSQSTTSAQSSSTKKSSAADEVKPMEKAQTASPTPEVKEAETKEEEVARINALPNDLSRIIQYNKKNYPYDHYGVVDKKNCSLTIYNKEGQIVKKFVVGIGKTKGDALVCDLEDDKHKYTTPGEFILDDYPQAYAEKGYTGTDGNYRFMSLVGDNCSDNKVDLGIHVVYNNEQHRIKGIKSPGVEDNRFSYGCVNLLQKDYDLMHKYLEEGDKIYILPEEKGNKLLLEKQQDGSYIFHQQHYKDVPRTRAAQRSANRVIYDVRKDRNPRGNHDIFDIGNFDISPNNVSIIDLENEIK